MDGYDFIKVITLLKSINMSASPISGYQFTREDNSRGGHNGKRGPSIKTIVREIGDMDVPETIRKKFLEERGIDLSNMSIAKALAVAGAQRALEGSTADWREFNDRYDGKAKQEIEVNTLGEKTLLFEVIETKDADNSQGTAETV